MKRLFFFSVLETEFTFQNPEYFILCQMHMQWRRIAVPGLMLHDGNTVMPF